MDIPCDIALRSMPESMLIQIYGVIKPQLIDTKYVIFFFICFILFTWGSDKKLIEYI